MGRFAPSPTGPLHFGSAVAAVGSWLDARAAGGRWLVRIEDVDLPRTVPGAEAAILGELARLGLEWDGEPVRQSLRGDLYREALERLRTSGRAFDCACSRKEMADSGLARDGSRRYPGTCRGGIPAGKAARAVRFLTDGKPIRITDPVQGEILEDVEREVGDFVLLRADGIFAYQLAVVVDDADQGVTEVVRGADLLDSTGRQIQLAGALGLPRVGYLHLPVASGPDGAKLSKQTGARSLEGADPGRVLAAALGFLGQEVAPGAERLPVGELLASAVAGWSRERIPRRRSLPAPGGW